MSSVRTHPFLNQANLTFAPFAKRLAEELLTFLVAIALLSKQAILHASVAKVPQKRQASSSASLLRQGMLIRSSIYSNLGTFGYAPRLP